MKPLIIVPIKSRGVQNALHDTGLAQRKGADAIEFRLDHIAPKSAQELNALTSSTGLPCIATCRPKREGGAFTGSEEKRIELLKQAVLAGAKFVDIELSTPPRLRGSLVKFAHSNHAKAIVSFHDFTKTPSLSALARILQKEIAAGADVCKIVALAKSKKDNETMLELLAQAREKKIPAIIFAMGRVGVESRKKSLVSGAWAGFASLGRGKETARGQLSIEEMRGALPQGTTPYGTEKSGVCCLLGLPVSHSASPAMQNSAFEARGIDAKYVALPVAPEKLAEVFREMRRWPNFLGANVTIPHKEEAAKLVDTLDPSAAKIGAINVAAKKGGKLAGFNTDSFGFLQALRKKKFQPKNKNCVVLGAGGAGRSIAFALAPMAKKITVLNRSLGSAQKLAADVWKKTGKKMVAAQLSDSRLESALSGAHLLANATSIGMAQDPNRTPVPKKFLHKGLVVFDAVYNPRETMLLREAKKAGCKTVSGDAMLLFQGAKAFEIWTGKKAPLAQMRRALEAKLKAQGQAGKKGKNCVALVGFMGTGKTLAGKALAKLLGKKFVDTDALVEKGAGSSVSEIFSRKGEVFFRGLEKKAVKKACAKGNAVVSTGGGVVLDFENVAELREKCTLVLLESTPEEVFENLEGHSNRPLLHSINSLEKIRKIREMLAWRKPYYLQADFAVHTKRRAPGEIAGDIASKLTFEKQASGAEFIRILQKYRMTENDWKQILKERHSER